MKTLVGQLGAVLLFAAGAVSVYAEDPAKPASQGAAAQKNPFEGLGFSIAPREGGKARTSLFGVVGEGYKFVYVFDRSGSMGGQGENSLQAVKKELLASLKNLDTVHQFQIVFYNQRPALFNPTGTPGRLAFATEQNKRRATRFIRSIVAEGGTAHEEALRAAIRIQPDVIFFLTDADDPILPPAQMKKILHAAAGIIINTIEFGAGPKPAGESFLAQLARKSGGGYAYIDTSKHKGLRGSNL